MARLNTNRKPQLPPQGGTAPARWEPSNTVRTHEGAPAAHITPELALRRSVCSCLLWEDEFYESGQNIAARISELAGQVPPRVLGQLAIDARSHFNLRHVPLLLCAVLARTGAGSRLVGDTLAETVQRADELSEFLAVYARINGVEPKDLKKKLSAQVKKGLAAAFGKFDRYQLAKYFSPSAEAGQPIKARDVMFMVHPKPRDAVQAELWKALIAGEVKSADTWEVALSTGPAEGTTREEHKRETFTRQLQDQTLGYLALLRNLRNMAEAGVDHELISQAILARRGARRVLPFRYVAAARACPVMSQSLDQALIASINQAPFSGITTILVDVSGSMSSRLSGKSELTRMDAAATLAAVFPGNPVVKTFSNSVVTVPEARGLSGINNIVRSQNHGGTELGAAVRSVRTADRTADRLVVITDEQAHDHVEAPSGVERCYMINVASARNGVGYGSRWVHIDGFSEQTIRFIREFETLPA